MENEGIINVNVEKLIQENGGKTPFNDCCWFHNDRPITAQEIQNAVELNDILSPGSKTNNLSSHDDHVRRIAWFVIHGATDPIIVDVGCLGVFREYIIEDGYHRFAAAIYLGNETIPVSASGDCEIIEQFLC